MSDLLTHIERSVMVDVDPDKEPQCEGLDHPRGLHGHDDGPAKYRVFFSCACSPRSVMACAGRAAFFREVGARCLDCGHLDYGPDLLITEL